MAWSELLEKIGEIAAKLFAFIKALIEMPDKDVTDIFEKLEPVIDAAKPIVDAAINAKEAE